MRKILNKRFTVVAGNWFAVLLLTICSLTISAGGIRDVAPTAADAPVMLETENPDYGDFATYVSGPEKRLIASIGNVGEVIYLGLAPEYNDDGDPYNSLTVSRYEFRIRRINPDGTATVVHGPFRVDNLSANVNSWEEAEFGSYSVTRLQDGQEVYVYRPDQPGDYSIEFEDVNPDRNNRVLIPFWDFTVTNQAGDPIDGRVWSRSWSFRTPPVTGVDQPLCAFDRTFNGDLYSYTEDGFVSRIDFTDAGFIGLSFSVAFNTSGPGTSGNLAEDRKSIPGVNATAQAAQHRIFLSLPDENLFPSGECGSVTAGEAFRCDGDNTYCLDVTVTNPGQVEVVLDFDGNGVLNDGGQDVSIIYEFTADELSACIPWDGLLGDGTPVGGNDTVDIIINYAQGIQHWATFDVEFMNNGFCVETVRPICAQQLTSNTLYWDDRDIPEDPGTGAPKDNRGGDDCNDTPRSWNNFQIAPGQSCIGFDDAATTGYGDKSTLNTYWFANTQNQFSARVPIVSVGIEGTTAICAGAETTLTAIDQSSDGIVSFEWNGPNVDGIMTESITITEEGEYCVTVVSEAGCTNTVCATVTVIDFNSDQFPEDLLICVGDSIQVPTEGDTSLIYSWSPATGIDDVTSNQPTFFPTETTVYTATVTLLDGANTCQTQETVTVTVSPEIGLQVVGGGPICEASTTITATVMNDALIELLDDDGNVIASANGTSASFELAVSGSNDYSVRATNGDDCTETAEFNVTGGPVDIALPDTIITCLTQEVDITVQNLDPNDMLTYSWSPADLFASGTETTDMPEFIGGAGAYTISLTATNQFGCTTTETLDLFVIDENDGLSFTAQVDCDGRTVAFTNTSTVGFGYLWLFGDGTFSTETNPTHTYPSIGDYNVTLTLIFEQECLAEFNQTVTTVEAALDAGITASLDDCDGTNGTLNFMDGTLNFTGGTLSYDWTFTGVTPTSSAEENPSTTVSQSGTVTASLTVTSSTGCTSTSDTTFTVELNEIELMDVTICPGESTELNPGGDDDMRTFSWSPSPDFDPTESNPSTSVAGTYSVTVTSDNADFNCESVTMITVTVADSINLAVSGPDGPLTGPDAPGGGLDLPTVQTCGEDVDLTADLSDNGDNTITVTYTDINGNPLGDGTGITLTPNAMDTVIVTATNQFGCTTMDTIVINNNRVNAAIDANADGLSFCSSIDTSVTVINNRPGDMLTYLWTANDIITGPLDEETVMITSPAEGSVDLMVLVTNQFGCDTTITVTIENIPFSPAEIPDVNACAGDNAPGIFAGGTTPGLEYSYDPSDNVNLNDPDNPLFVGTMDETINVTITDPATGCSAVRTVNATYRDLTGVMANANPREILLEDETVLTATGCDDCDFTWTSDSGSGTITPDNGATVTGVPGEAGTTIYTVQASSSGCSAVDTTAVIVIDPLCEADRVFVPTAFTPNGDNINDVARVQSGFGERLTEFRWIIYDRWGQEVYASDDYDGFWDGTAEGDDLEPDVYGYWLRVVCPGGEELIQQGNITILR